MMAQGALRCTDCHPWLPEPFPICTLHLLCSHFAVHTPTGHPLQWHCNPHCSGTHSHAPYYPVPGRLCHTPAHPCTQFCYMCYISLDRSCANHTRHSKSLHLLFLNHKLSPYPAAHTFQLTAAAWGAFDMCCYSAAYLVTVTASLPATQPHDVLSGMLWLPLLPTAVLRSSLSTGATWASEQGPVQGGSTVAATGAKHRANCQKIGRHSESGNSSGQTRQVEGEHGLEVDTTLK
jgi:hypothetical protein